ncbi:MAG: hypothetical protein Q9213_001137 [Squamulea squamosa]
MEAMERHLLPTKTQTGRKMHILHGLGGIGKTQLAIAHARKHQHTYSAILWVNGNSRDTVLQSLSAFSRRAVVDVVSESTAYAARRAPDMEAEVAAVMRWLALEGNHRWLVIFDNVDKDVRPSGEDSQAFDIVSFLPPADHGSVLITTRLPSLGEIGRSTEVGRLTLDQALELLRRRSGLQPSGDDMAKLVKRLGYLPLALVQAGTYMRETKTGCLKYIELYKASWSQLMAQTPRLRDYENGSIQTTWMISYECVRQDNQTAGKLLQLWAYLDHRDVWYQLLRRGYDGCPEESSWLQALAGSEIGFKRIMKSLLAYSLIESHRDRESYSMHPVVHDWCAETIGWGQYDLMVAALTIVGAAVPGHSETEYWLLEQRLLPHVDQCVQRIDDMKGLHRLESTEAVDALHSLGILYADQGKHVEAEKMYRRALDGKEKAWGAEHTSTLDTVNNLGNLYSDQGKMAEAEEMYMRALKGYEKVWGTEHISTLDTVNNLAVLYKNQGKMAEAEEMYIRALKGKEKAWGVEHISTLDTVNNLAVLYSDQGKMAEAEEIYIRALKGKEKAWGAEHISTLDTVNNLAVLYYHQGKIAEAEEIYIRALKGKEKAWGAEHTSTLDTVNNLAVLYYHRGKMAEAEEMYMRALKGYEKVWGAEHISTLDTVNNLAVLYKNQGKMAEAEEMYRRALDGYINTRGSGHPSTRLIARNLSLLRERKSTPKKGTFHNWLRRLKK